MKVSFELAISVSHKFRKLRCDVEEGGHPVRDVYEPPVHAMAFRK